MCLRWYWPWPCILSAVRNNVLYDTPGSIATHSYPLQFSLQGHILSVTVISSWKWRSLWHPDFIPKWRLFCSVSSISTFIFAPLSWPWQPWQAALLHKSRFNWRLPTENSSIPNGPKRSQSKTLKKIKHCRWNREGETKQLAFYLQNSMLNYSAWTFLLCWLTFISLFAMCWHFTSRQPDLQNSTHNNDCSLPELRPSEMGLASTGVSPMALALYWSLAHNPCWSWVANPPTKVVPPGKEVPPRGACTQNNTQGSPQVCMHPKYDRGKEQPAARPQP